MRRSRDKHYNPDTETLESLMRDGLMIIQKRSYGRFTMDAVLLAHFVETPGGEIADLGSGSGIIALLLSALHPSARITAVELQEELVDMAQRSIELNGLQGRVDMKRADLRCPVDLGKTGAFSTVVSNPPYRKEGAGPTSADQRDAMARYEVTLTLKQLCSAAAVLLRPKGRLFMSHLPQRLGEVFSALRTVGLEPKEMRFIHPRATDQANLVLIQARKQVSQGLRVLPPLVVRDNTGEYTDEIISMYGLSAVEPGVQGVEE